VRITREAEDIVGAARIGMLALRSAHGPLINPAAFHYMSGSVWMTTSRFAVKTVVARRDPRAAFFVDGGSRAVMLRGRLEVFDPLSVSAQVRALLGGPSLYMGMLGYTLKNAPFIAGYLLDITRLPREWMPYNRVVLRLIVSDADIVELPDFPEALAARVPAVPAEVGRRLAGVARGYACWLDGTRPVIAPALWEADHGRVYVAPVGSDQPHRATRGALVVESHHRYRPSLMVGACVRGSFGSAGGGDLIAQRYDVEAGDVPDAFELVPERVTSWRGFAITSAVPKGAKQLRLAEG
jgi:pyridoxamine 5'-phosphate oxidase-like protein